MKITAHCLVKNEGNYIWFSIMSVIQHVDKILIYDTGSEDDTLEIIRILKKDFPSKIVYKSIGNVDAFQYTEIRQKMLDDTKTDWFMVLDGDEVWWKDSISRLTSEIRGKEKTIDSVVVRYKNLVGDVFHFQEEKAARYKIDGKVGSITLKAINMKIPGLYTSNPHGTHGYFDDKKILVQERNAGRRLHLDDKESFLHFTHLKRSSREGMDKKVIKRPKKFKYEFGEGFPRDYFYPEVFFLPRPSIVPSPWKTIGMSYKLLAVAETPLRKIKRRLLKGKTGY